MPDALVPVKQNAVATTDTTQAITMTIFGQLFGVPTQEVQDVHNSMTMTRVPLAPPEVAGALNIRGKIVTAIDLRTRLGLPAREPGEKYMSVVVEYQGDLYSLIIDNIGEVLTLDAGTFEKNPSTLDPVWREVATGVYRLEGQLLIMTSVQNLMNFLHT